MPHLIFSGVKKDDVKKLSIETLDNMANICDTTTDNFIYEFTDNPYFSNGKEMEKYPLIEVKMFYRGDEVEEKIFSLIKEELEKMEYNDIEVYFIHLKEESYYY